jgi:hypothetical protein
MHRVRTFARLAGAALLGAALGPPAPAAAQVACGDTIGPKETVVLTADLAGCTSATDPALRVVGPATLDMNGFRVLCDQGDPPTGVRVEGTKAKVLRGGADGCVSGLDLTGGGGRHQVEDFVATRSSADGVAINSGGNKLRRVASTGSGDDGFDVDGDGNKIDDAEAVGSGGEGFEIGGDGNKLKRILATGSTQDGIAFLGDGNSVKDGRFAANLEDGIDIDGDGNKVDRSVASANGDGDDVDPFPVDAGVEVDGDDNQLTKLLVLDNDSSGIWVTTGADRNLLKQNTSLGHDLDARQEGADCGTNRWQKNEFGSSDAGGASDPPCIQ